MGIRSFSVLICLWISLVNFTACQNSPDVVLDTDALEDFLFPEQVPSKQEGDGILQVWTYDPEVTPNRMQFRRRFSDLDMVITVKDDYVNSYLEALATHTAPDVLIINHKDFGQFNDLNRLMDLQTAPEIVTALADQEKASRFIYGKDLKNQRLVGVLVGLVPWNLYYRWDVLSEMGFETDPEIFGDAIQDADYFLELLRTLKAEDRYLFMWPDELFLNFLESKNFHDANYLFDLNVPPHKDVYELSRVMLDERLFSGESIYDTGGAKAVAEKRIVGALLPTWAQYFIPEFFSDTFGTWQMTQMPLGIQRIDGSMILVNRDTPYDFQARQLILDWVEEETLQMRYESWQDPPFFNKQPIGQFYREAIVGYEPVYHTIKDAQIQSLYEQSIREGIGFGWSMETVIGQMKRRIGLIEDDE